MTTVGNLLKHLVKYNEYDIPLTANPQITYNCKTLENLHTYRRHTNTQYGLVKLDCSSQNHWILNPSDICVQLIICIDNLDNLNFIKITFNSSSLELDLNYLKLLNIVLPNTISKFGNTSVITLDMVNLFDVNSGSNAVLKGVPVFQKKVEIQVEPVNEEFSFVEVKSTCVLADTNERRKIASYYSIDGLRKIQLPVQDLNGSDKIVWLNPTPFDCVCVCVDDTTYGNIQSIDLEYGGQTIAISKQVLEMYNKLFEKILFKHGDKTLIKLKVISGGESDINVKINYLDCNLPKSSSCYLMKNLKQDYENYLCVFNKSVNTYFNSWVFSLDDSIDGTVEIDLENTHIKNLVIYYTDGNSSQPFPLANKFDLIFDRGVDNISTYTDLDCWTFQQSYSINPADTNINVINFTSDPLTNYPNGQINITSLIQINYTLKYSGPNVQMHVIAFGYQVLV